MTLASDGVKGVFREGYLIGRFFGVAWASILCVGLFSLPNTDNSSVSVLIGIWTALLLSTEFYGPMFGIIVLSLIKLVNRGLTSRRHTGFVNLFIVGIIYWIATIPIIYIDGNALKESTTGASLFVSTYLEPLLLVLMIALSDSITNSQLGQKHIKIHTAIRIAIILFLIAMWLVNIPLAVQTGWNLNEGNSQNALMGLIGAAIMILLVIFRFKIFRYPL